MIELYLLAKRDGWPLFVVWKKMPWGMLPPAKFSLAFDDEDFKELELTLSDKCQVWDEDGTITLWAVTVFDGESDAEDWHKFLLSRGYQDFPIGDET